MTVNSVNSWAPDARGPAHSWVHCQHV